MTYEEIMERDRAQAQADAACRRELTVAYAELGLHPDTDIALPNLRSSSEGA
jgi:hypothetical protein